MRSLVSHLLAGLVSACVSVSAWADGSDGSENILIAPQLAVAGTGPVTATFLTPVSDPLFRQLYAFTPAFNIYPLTNVSNPVPTPVLSAGGNITLAASFGIPGANGEPPLSEGIFISTATGGIDTNEVSDRLMAHFSPTAAVIETDANRVLVGFDFNPFGAAPRSSGFDGFPVRIAVSNVCVR